VTLAHPPLVKLLKQAYSAEKAAAFAYIGHAKNVKSLEEKLAIQQIETDEWEHRASVLAIMDEYEISISKFYEFKYHLIGRTISALCYVIGRFMPFFFAGKLESGNVCEYFRMRQYFNSLGISKHDHTLYHMGIKEKEHEVYFFEKVKDDPLLPTFEKIFSWGANKSANNVDLENQLPPEDSGIYCKKTI
jgi:hypothetical protein